MCISSLTNITLHSKIKSFIGIFKLNKLKIEAAFLVADSVKQQLNNKKA